MASTYLSLHYHIVFGTKDRMPLIGTSWRPRLHEYLGGAVKGLGGIPEAVGGVADHVHLLVALNSTHCLADFMRDLKKSATGWVHENIGTGGKFSWQNGYAAFSVSATSRDAVREYIAKQEEHHRTKSFREEWIAMLDRAGIVYDPEVSGLRRCEYSRTAPRPLRGRIDIDRVHPGCSSLRSSTPG